MTALVAFVAVTAPAVWLACVLRVEHARLRVIVAPAPPTRCGRPAGKGAASRPSRPTLAALAVGVCWIAGAVIACG